MGRPKKDLDPEIIKNLAAINCTMEEIASVMGCSKDTIERRFAAIVKEGRDTGKVSLRREMWKAVKEKGNITMMIWLSKQLLGYTDKVTQITAEINQPTDQKIQELANKLALVKTDI